MVAASSGVFYFVEPVPYYVILSMTGTYLNFLSGNVGNVRVPCAALASDVTHSIPRTVRVEMVPIVAICGSVIANLISTTPAAIVGGVVLSMPPEFIVVGPAKYTSLATLGATFGNFTVKYPKVVVFALATPVILKMTTELPVATVIVRTVFDILFIAKVFYKEGLVR